MKSSTFFLFAAAVITLYSCDSSFMPYGKENQDEADTKTAETDKNAQAQKRALPALAAGVLKNPAVQKAVVDKGLDVMNQLVDKQLRIIDEAQEKASKFLAKEIKLDIMPDKAWSTPDMFIPAGYHMGASISDVGQSEPKEHGEVPYTYAPNTGLGYVMMNGCYGKNYTPSDPCYNAKFASPICLNMIDGAAFLGVGFDGRGTFSPESRKMSIVQRNCKNKATYDDLDVPDTMNVHGVYDTSAYMLTFESRSEYQTYMQQEAGVSGSVFGFYAGVNEAYGSSSAGAKQTFLSILDVDVDRYEIFMDEVKPQDLSLSFLREFMNLPNSYFDPGAPLKYQNFIQRWGTHYIKSAKFGGELEIRKTKQAEQKETKTQFAEKMEMEYKSLFASVGAKYSKQGGYQQREQTKTTSTSLKVQGGSQEIASILSDAYSPTFKNEFKEWLQSIPKYPKAFKFLMGSISDLVNFRAHDLFPEEKVTWGCEGKVANMETEEDGRRFYKSHSIKGKTKKIYCQYDSRKSLENAIMERRTSLTRAIEINLEEGPISLTDIKLEQCTSKRRDQRQLRDSWARGTRPPPKWKELIQSGASYLVEFDMMDDLINPLHKAFTIRKNMTRKLQYRDKDWYTSDENNVFHLYSGFGENVKDMRQHKISIFGLTLSYKEKDGSLVLEEQDYQFAKKTFPAIAADLKGMRLAHIETLEKGSAFERVERRQSVRPTTPPPPPPCKPTWSNSLRMELHDMKGKCVHFTAASSGTIKVLFSAKPTNLEKRYVVEISPTIVRIFKGKTANDKNSNSTKDVDAVGLGEKSLYEAYFVCITISAKRSMIEYGKGSGTRDTGSVYLTMIDKKRDFEIRFYAFENTGAAAKIMDAHIVSRELTEISCKGNTVKDAKENLCGQGCHKTCDPFEGCKKKNDDKKCGKCRTVKKVGKDQCLEECASPEMINKKKECVESYDLKIEKDVQIANRGVLPGVEEYTMCYWLRLVKDWINLAQTQSGASDTGARVISAYKRNVNGELVYITYTLRPSQDPSAPIYMRIDWSTEKKILHLPSLTDKRWHQLCHSWSSKTSAWAIYFDGSKKKTGTHDFKPTSSLTLTLGPGSLQQVGDNKLLLTQLNVWDHFLTSQDIENLAKKCNAGVGNLYSWAEVYDASKAASFSKPSTCKIETAIPTAAPTTKASTTKAPKTNDLKTMADAPVTTKPSAPNTGNPNSEAPKPVAPEIVAPDSFDFKIEDGTEQVKRRAQEDFNSYTMCFWLRLVEAWKTHPTLDTSVRLFLVEMPKLDGNVMSMYYNLRGTQQDIYLSVSWESQTWKIQRLQALLDLNWHQVCHEWSASTMTFFVDGERGVTGNHNFSPASAITLLLGGGHSDQSASNKLTISQLNVWNQVLSSEDLSTFSKTCNAATGNVLSWAALYDASIAESSFSTPSTCVAASSVEGRALRKELSSLRKRKKTD